MHKLRYLPIYYTVAFLQGLCLVIIPAASSILKDSTQNAMNNTQYGLLSISMISATIISTLYLKKLLQIRSRAQIYAFACLCDIVYLLLVSCSYFSKGFGMYTFLILLVANLIQGFGMGMLIALLNMFMIELRPHKSDVLLSGLHGVWALGAASAPKWVHYWHVNLFWQGAALTCALAFCGITFIGYWVLVYASPTLSQAKDLPLKKAGPPSLKSDRFMGLSGLAWFFLMLMMLYAIIETVIGFWTVDYLYIERQLSMEFAMRALGVFWFSVACGRILVSLLATLVDAFFIYMASLSLLLLAFVLLLQSSFSVEVVFVYSLLGLGSSCLYPLLLSMGVRKIQAKSKEEALQIPALSITGLMVGIALANVGTGLLRQWELFSLEQIFICATGVVVLLLVLSLRQGQEN